MVVFKNIDSTEYRTYYPTMKIIINKSTTKGKGKLSLGLAMEILSSHSFSSNKTRSNHVHYLNVSNNK